MEMEDDRQNHQGEVAFSPSGMLPEEVAAEDEDGDPAMPPTTL